MTDLEKAMNEFKKEMDKLSPGEREEMFKYKPDEYEQAAIDFMSALSKEGSIPGLGGFALPQAFTYVMGSALKEPLEFAKQNALRLIDAGHTSYETRYDYGYVDQFAYAFFDGQDLCLVKYTQNIDYVVVFEIDTDYSKGDVHVRKFYREAQYSEYHMEELQNLANSLEKGEVNLALFEEIAGQVRMFADTSYREDFPHRPDLENAIHGVGLRYRDGRDEGYIGTFKYNRGGGVQVEKGYNIDTLTWLSIDLNTVIEDL